MGGYPAASLRVWVGRNTKLSEMLSHGLDAPNGEGLHTELPDFVSEVEAEWEYVPGQNYPARVLPPESLFSVVSGDGGGYGDPLERRPEEVLRDVTDGLSSERTALDVYAVVFTRDDADLIDGVDAEATPALRAQHRQGPARPRRPGQRIQGPGPRAADRGRHTGPRGRALPGRAAVLGQVGRGVPHVLAATRRLRGARMTSYPVQMINDLLEGTLPLDEVARLQRDKDLDRLAIVLELEQARVAWDDRILVPLQESLYVVERSDGARVVKCRCGQEFGDYRQNWKEEAAVYERHPQDGIVYLKYKGRRPGLADAAGVLLPGLRRATGRRARPGWLPLRLQLPARPRRMNSQRRPRIAISSGRAGVAVDAGLLPSYYLGEGYPRAVAAAGGIPLILPCVPGQEDELAAASLDGLDGLLLAGGTDIHPESYGQPYEPALTHDPDQVRDRFELALVRTARQRSLPVLGVCRGFQILNVAYGGSLSQHKPHEQARAVALTGTADRGDRRHTGSILPACEHAGHSRHERLLHPSPGHRQGRGGIARRRPGSRRHRRGDRGLLGRGGPWSAVAPGADAGQRRLPIALRCVRRAGRGPVMAAGPPLEGIKVVNFSRLFAGPYATMTLADLGAEVVKVESPAGDDARGFGPPFLGGEGMNYMALNRNKRSIVLDLKKDGGLAVARRLTADADVVFENFRPGVAEKLGIGYNDLAPANPGLVYCSISGFGRVGEYSDRPALDIILQAMTGVMDRQGNGGDPRLLVVTVADTYAAALAVQSVLAALLARSRDGQGQRVEVTLLEALIAAQGYRIISPAGEIMLPAIDDTCPYQAFAGSDGQWFVIAVVSSNNWTALCTATGLTELGRREDLATNSGRVQARGEVIGELERVFLSGSRRMAAAATGRGGALQPGPQGGGPDERLARAGPRHRGRGGSPHRRTAEDDGQRTAPRADPGPDRWSRAAPGRAHRADPPRARLRQRGDRPAV